MYHDVYLINISRKTNQVQFPIWASVLVNSLKLHNIEPKVIDLIPVDEENREEFFKRKLSKGPAIFGFSIIAGNNHLNEVEKYAKIVLDANPNNIAVYGGPLPSAVPELLLKNCLCSYIIAGEGEFSFPSLVQSIFKGKFYPENIPGLYYKKGEVVVGTKNKRILQLNYFSKPDYSLFDMDFYINYLKETGQSFEIMASRGCRGNCSFCYKVCGPGLSIRSADSILDEISEIIEKFGITRFYFVDENFLESKKFFYEFIQKKRERRLEFTFIGQARIDAIDRDLCRTGSENGLICISTGIESASQGTLDIANKRITIEETEDKIKLMREFNIRISANFIIGFPWETADDYKALVAFIEKNKLEKQHKLSYLTPLPSTRIYQEAIERGLIKDEFAYIKNLGDLYWERMINLTSLPDDVLDYYYQKISVMGQKDVVYPKSKTYLRQIRKIH